MYYLSRRLNFSSSHYYYIPSWSEEKNREVFGVCSNRNGHGHDYTLEVMVHGQELNDAGIVINTNRIKELVSQFLERELDGFFLNKEHSFFQQHNPTTENIAKYIWDYLKNNTDAGELYRIRLHENHYLYAEKEEGNVVSLTRKYHFCAAHRLHANKLSDEENKRIFGKCNNLNGHGHNYYLEVTVKGEPNQETGMVVHLNELDQVVEENVLQKFDHKHLNLDTIEFKDRNPTSEIIAMVIYELLQPKLSSLYKIGLWETDKNYFEYYGPLGKGTF